MADEFDPDAYLAKKREPQFDPDAYLASKRGQPSEHGVLDSAVDVGIKRPAEAAAKTFTTGLTHAKELFTKPPEPGFSGALENLGTTAKGVLSPLTMTLGPVVSAVASPFASGLGYLERKAKQGIAAGTEAAGGTEVAKRMRANIPTSEGAYEEWLPKVETALSAAGRPMAPGSRMPMPRPLVPGKSDEAIAGRVIEERASDPMMVRHQLATGKREIVPGSEPTTYQLTDDKGLGQLERVTTTRDAGTVQAQREAQNAARLRAIEEAQKTGSPQEVARVLQEDLRVQERTAEVSFEAARQRAWEATRRMGGENDPATYGNVLRQELRNAEEAVRAEEAAFWQQVDPNGVLRLDPLTLQRTERGIYGVMPEGGAAEASLTAGERQLTEIIQNYPAQIPLQELRDFASLLTTRMREELWTNGRSPAYGRMSRLRQGVADAENDVFGALGQRDTGLPERLREARTATRERAEQFSQGPVGRVLRRQGTQGPFQVGEASVPERFVQQGAKGYDSASSFLRASPGSLGELQEAVAASARREAINPDGSINPRRLDGWLKRYQDTLRAIDERDGGAFSQRLRNVGTAQETLAEAQAAREAVTARAGSDTFKGIIGAADDETVTNVIGSIFGRVDAVPRARELMSRVTTPEAQDGARRAVMDYIRNRFVSNAPAGGADNMIRAEQFQTFMKDPTRIAALRQILSPEQVATLQAVAADIRRMNRSVQTKVRGGSNTAQDITALMEERSRLLDLTGAAAHFVLGRIPYVKHAKTAVMDMFRGMRAKGREGRIKGIESLVNEAMADPDLAAKLLSQTQVEPGGMMGVLGYQAGMQAPQLERQTGEPKQKRPSRQAGGGVPAIGGTGGRSPGARETARAGAARRGPSQALQDGGEARDQQAAAPVGGRERFAAALQGTPTGAGFGGGGGQQRKAQPAKTMSREDIRRTLQSFGITGEDAGGFAGRQLGEVDSRAAGGAVKRTKASVDYSKGMKESRCGICQHYADHKCELVQGYIGPGMWCELFKKKTAFATGGSVDYETGERTPMHYDPGDDTTFDARFGKWDQTATGKSLPRDDEDVDSSIMVPGQRMIDPLGHRGVRGRAGYYETRGMEDGGKVGFLPQEGEEKAGWPLQAIVLGSETIPFAYRDKLTLDTAKAQRNPIAETDLTNPQQWLRFKRDRLQDFMENAPRPTGSIERRYGPLEKLRPEPQINYQNHPLTLEARGEQPSVLAEQLGYRSIAPRAMAGPTERIPLPRPRPYQEGGEVEDRFAGLPSSSNIEDRRDEDELTPGQMIAANQAFMGHYPTPYTRASRRQGVELPNALVEQTKSYLADQINGVEREHEKQDPLEAVVEDQGGHEHPHGEGGSDEGKDPFERAARRQAQAVRPERGHRKEGLATGIISSVVPGVLSFPERFTKMSMGAAEGDPEKVTGREQFELLQYMTGMGPRAGPAGSVVMAGRRGSRAPPVPPELRAGEVPAADRPVGRGHNMPPEELPVETPKSTGAGRMRALRELPYDEAMAAAKTERHLVPRESGGYEGAPEWVKTPEDLVRLRAHLDEQARKGVAGRTWYERGQEGVKEMAGPEPHLQRLAAREHALFSPKATPETNLGFQIQAHNAYEAGKPLDIAYTGQQARTYKQGRETGDIQLGKKTGPYASHLNPQEETPAIPVNDIHHLENFQYEKPEGGASAATHAFMDAETLLAAHRANQIKLGGHQDWTPGRIQAAAWVEAKAQALMQLHGWSYEKAMADAINAYIEHFPKYTAYGTHEATPGIGTRHLPGIAQGTEAERAAFSADPRSFWRDPSGRDIMYRGLGMWTRPTIPATGIFRTEKGPQEINPAEVGRPMVSFSGPTGDRSVTPTDRAMMNAAEAARAYVDVQNMGAWSIPILKQKTGVSTSALVDRPGAGPLPIGDIGRLQTIGGRHGLPEVIDYGEGAALTTFGEGPTGRQLGKSTLPQEVGQHLGVPPERVRQVKLDSDSISYESLWGEKEGTGAVTRELQKYLTNPDAPAIITKLDSSKELRQSVAAKLARDTEIAAATGQPIRGDVQLARKIIIEEGFTGLFRALKAGAALPAMAFAPLVQLFRQGEEVNRGE